MKQECGGREVQEIYMDKKTCAHTCKNKSSLFVHGTNDYGKIRCGTNVYDYELCSCICETAATPDGTCSTIPNKGYRLYKYKGNYEDQSRYVIFL